MSENLQGGCYCGAIRYELSAKPTFKAQCHCRACQHISGGGPNYFMAIPEDGFTYTNGAPSEFTRNDIEAPVTREFCGICGTHMVTRRPGMAAAIVKIGTLDDPARFRGPRAAIYMAQAQDFHVVAEGIPCFDDVPGP